MSTKNELTKLDKNALVEIIADLYKKNKSVKEYIDFYFKPNESDLAQKYRDIIYQSFYPKRGFRYNLKAGKQAISDYKKLAPSTKSIADLMMFYVETGVKFTSDFGDIDEPFYNSMEVTFAAALKIMQKEDLLDEFKQRATLVLKDTKNMGWGFHDGLYYTFHQVF
jgi:hypothetical protein